MDREEKSYAEVKSLSEEVLKNLSDLMEAINQCDDPILSDLTFKWKHEKGVPNLIRTVVKVDKLITDRLENSENVVKGNENQGDAHSISQSRSREKLNKLPLKQIKNERNHSFPTHKKLSPKKGSSLPEPEQNPQQVPAKDSNYRPSLDRLISFKKDERESPKKEYTRGPYRSYTKDIKERVVRLHEEQQTPITQISKKFGIPIKNIKRWCEQGVERKEGAGRKRLDPEMEESLHKEILKRYPGKGEIDTEQIRKLALSLSNVPEFKASRGWIVNFFQRYTLQNTYTLV